MPLLRHYADYFSMPRRASIFTFSLMPRVYYRFLPLLMLIACFLLRHFRVIDDYSLLLMFHDAAACCRAMISP